MDQTALDHGRAIQTQVARIARSRTRVLATASSRHMATTDIRMDTGRIAMATRRSWKSKDRAGTVVRYEHHHNHKRRVVQYRSEILATLRRRQASFHRLSAQSRRRRKDGSRGHSAKRGNGIAMHQSPGEKEDINALHARNIMNTGLHTARNPAHCITKESRGSIGGDVLSMALHTP